MLFIQETNRVLNAGSHAASRGNFMWWNVMNVYIVFILYNGLENFYLFTCKSNTCLVKKNNNK